MCPSAKLALVHKKMTSSQPHSLSSSALGTSYLTLRSNHTQCLIPTPGKYREREQHYEEGRLMEAYLPLLCVTDSCFRQGRDNTLHEQNH